MKKIVISHQSSVIRLTGRSLAFSCLLLATNYLLPAVHAAPANLGEQYGFGGLTSLGQGLGFLVTPLFVVAATMLFFYTAFGAFKFITSGGDKGAVAQAREMMVHAIIGFVLLLVMFLLLKYIPEVLLKGSGFKIIG